MATLRRAIARDPAALRALIDHHAPAVFGLLSRMLDPVGRGALVEDLAQETMLRVIGAIERFDPDGPARLSTWVLTIASRLALQELQRRRPEFVPDAEQALAAGQSASPEAQLSARQLRAAVRAVVAEMSPQLRAAFVLSDAHGLTPAEVATALAVPPATARTRIHRARGQIRAALGESDD